jgi:hypothetical protein
MGHRKEVFRPRTKQTERKGIEDALRSGEFKKAATIAAFSYSDRPIADDFAISLVATAEAVSLGKELRWKRSTEDLVSAGLSIAERKLDSKVNRRRRPIIFESISRSVERVKKKESEESERK